MIEEPATNNQKAHLLNSVDDSASTVASSPQVRILTLNFFLRPLFIVTNGNDYKSERLNYFLEHYMKDFDVICFQEVFELHNMRKYELIEQAEKLGFAYHCNSPAPGFFT